MFRHLLFGAAAIALAVASGPVRAQQLAGEIEGPISNIDPAARTITVMGITVSVPEGTPIHTPTAAGLTLEQLATGPMPGRTEPGFLGGTGIITGESTGGQFVATDVFTDLFEHVVVGEATGVDDATGRMTINGMPIRRSTDSRMPAAPPINGFGLRIVPASINNGTLVAAEGYYSSSQRVLYYHALEADSALLVNQTDTQVSILRADCRIRGGGRDEIEVRGGAAIPGNAFVQIRIHSPTANNPNRFLSIGTVQAVADPTTSPSQGLYRADFRTLNLINPITGANECPREVRAVILATSPGATRTTQATADLESR